jgi:enoyl-CoA hydratase
LAWTPAFAGEQDMSDSIIAGIEGRTGRIRLNRPKALHALDLDMVRAITAALQDWQQDPAVKLILIDHAEGRGFCAGGDVVTIAKSAEGHGAAGQAFFFQEYRMNHLMYTYPKRGVVFMDGITMGGGVGISCPCKYRIATERTVPSGRCSRCRKPRSACSRTWAAAAISLGCAGESRNSWR